MLNLFCTLPFSQPSWNTGAVRFSDVAYIIILISSRVLAPVLVVDDNVTHGVRFAQVDVPPRGLPTVPFRQRAILVVIGTSQSAVNGAVRCVRRVATNLVSDLTVSHVTCNGAELQTLDRHKRRMLCTLPV